MRVIENEEEPQEEVRCICPKCEGEGWCVVSKARANELKAQELMEECCPFGDACVYESDSDEEPQDICCKCGRFWNKGLVCDCGCSHRVCCDTCKD